METWENGEQEYKTIVLPRKYQRRLLKLAHSMLMAGHLGQDGQTDPMTALLANYLEDVEHYSQRSPECQLTPCKGRQGAPMLSLLIMGEPFERIAMDVVGPLPKSKQGHRYILVACDYATRHPEAISLKKFTAPIVTEELANYFPDTDQGINFTSQLLQELY